MISDQYKFIFVHVARTGGTSFERVAGMPVTNDPRTQHIGNTDFVEKHKPFEYYYQTYPDKFDVYFKFTIVRNPFSRLLSAWLWRTRIVRDLACTFSEFVQTRPISWHYVEKFKLPDMDIAQSLARFDYVGKYEMLDDTYDFLCGKFGISRQSILHTNKTSHDDYRKYYDDDLIHLVYKQFGPDLDLFGYGF